MTTVNGFFSKRGGITPLTDLELRDAIWEKVHDASYIDLGGGIEMYVSATFVTGTSIQLGTFRGGPDLWPIE